ncbi:MAG: sugar phosphate isomerase/epimerase [Deltaproteobacteria bacterium]|jgi:sugar phosphate isomerase/epimerase|nr:sugar phosphate isomerase/epimerase [Deltaproteobacteria bacterium]
MKAAWLGAHIPWAQIETCLPQVLALGLAPEIAIKGPELEIVEEQLILRISAALQDAGVRPRVHAPFFDLNPGALDPLIRQATRQRLEQSLRFAGRLHADLMIIHPGVDKWRYPRLEDVWLEHTLAFFPSLVQQAEDLDCCLAIENIYEESPDTLVQLVSGIDSSFFGHCFDAGHWHLFGRRPMDDWLKSVSSKLFHLHLHDNHGRADEHLPVGDGTIDFSPLQRHLKGMSALPSITLEARSLEHLQRSLQEVNRLLI